MSAERPADNLQRLAMSMDFTEAWRTIRYGDGECRLNSKRSDGFMSKDPSKAFSSLLL